MINMRPQNLVRVIFYSVLVLILFALFGGISLYTDWLWFTEISFQKIFTTIWSTRLLAGLIAGLAVFGIAYLNIFICEWLTKEKKVHKRLRPKPLISEEGNIERSIDIDAFIKKFTVPVLLVIAVMAGFFAAGQWQTILQYIHQTPFGINDPIFLKDVSYYIFTLPFIQLFLSLGLFVIIISFLSSAILHYFKGAISFQRGSLTFDRSTTIHLSVLLALGFGLAALKIYFVRIPELLYSTTGPLFGASYTAIYAQLPFLKILFVISILASLAILFGSLLSERKARTIVVSAFILYIGASIIGGFLYPLTLEQLVVKPNELVKETQFIKHHIAATQKAWGIDTIEERDLGGESELTYEDIQNNPLTIKNIRLWDREPLLNTFGQIQEIRTYYDFISVDNDRYQLGKEYRQVMLSTRELNSESLPSRAFINERLTFTHGMGLTLGPVNEVTREGLPVLWIKDLPPVSSIPSLTITRPEIYFGELSNEYVIVKTKSKEFNYPSGEENIFSTYNGTGGVTLSSVLRKASLAWQLKSAKIILSNDITPESRILYFRNIYDRVRKALPFLRFDSDPYLVIADGRLKWIYDAYTTSNRYPYSQPVQGGMNYMRNSVKVVIDAYNGDLQAYVAYPEDPLIQTFSKMFPGIFKDIQKLPVELKGHIRYPQDLFAYQTALYMVYHMDQPQIFYNKEDQWEIPAITEKEPIMRHLIMRLPGEKKEEFILMLPFTPRGKNNLAAWVVARSDGKHYGKLIVYRFPKQSLVFGPQQIMNRINQDPEISQQLSLWDQGGSQVIRGNLLVIPIEESLIYVQPLYLKAKGGKIPELKRVIVAYKNKISMEETLDEALAAIFGRAPPKQEVREESVVDEKNLIRQAREHYDRAQQALRDTNWARYGEELQRLGEVLEQMASE
ncbi:MAG: UPF0182 family protein [Nanoarchaeota archaeon]|nr:UPF0182 family protein [Nanoarchaeota archaeon]